MSKRKPKTIASSDDARVLNNPSQRSAVPGDPMRLQFRMLTDDEKKTMGELKRDFEELWRRVDALGASRETSIAKTHLEDACMWAVKHLTRPGSEK